MFHSKRRSTPSHKLLKLLKQRHNKSLHPTGYSSVRSSLRFRQRVNSIVGRLARNSRSSEHKDMKEQAEVFRVGLLLGLFKLSDVIAWCDSVIMEEATPDIAIIEASISGSKGVNAVANALSEVEGEFNKRSVTKLIFRSMYDSVNQDRKQAPQIAEWLYRMAFDYGAPDEEAESEMTYYYDAIDLAVDGIYGDAEKLTEKMLQFLHEYSISAP